MTPPGIVLQGTLQLGDTALLSDIHVRVEAGKWTVLLGQSGVGKTTLARLVAGLPTAAMLNGSIRADDDHPLVGRVAVMAQDDQLLPWASLISNITIGSRLRGERPDQSRARDLLAAVGLSSHTDHKPDMLSTGQRQRVALARTLYEDRPVAVLDEPFSALDSVTRHSMQDLAATLLAGRTVLLITHDPQEAMRLADTALLLGSDAVHQLEVPHGSVPRPADCPNILSAQARLFQRLTEAHLHLRQAAA